ncbi:MAG: 2-polyprenylphenol 6-hydroxylase [Litoreibacter sp.]
MRGPHNIWRLVRTGATFERTGAMGVILDAIEAPAPLRIAARVLGWPFKWLGLKGDPEMPPVTRAITALGPAYIKFGQILSTRPDVVGEDLALQLRVLQDKLSPFPTDVAKEMVELEFGRPLTEIFSNFSDPVAAASIAQVHRATLVETGEDVAVKILRPDIERAFRKDIDAFYFAAQMVELLSPASRRLRPSDVIKHFDGVVRGELDLRLEGAAAGEYAANTESDEGFTVPKIHFFFSGKTVMTMEWAEGISFSDVDAVSASGLDRKAIGERALQLFLHQALNDGYFHGDMHQGNLKITENGDIIAYDFGIMGRIDEYTRRVYAEIIMGFIRRDYRRVAEVHFEAGYVPADQDVDEFAQALRAVGEPIFGMDATKISMARVLSYLFEVTERFGMQTRTDLILLQRTMVVVEGVARTMHPQINIWEVAQPVVESYVKANIGPQALLSDLVATTQVLARFGPKLPQLVEAALQAQIRTPEPERKRVNWSGIRYFGAGILSSLLIVGIVLFV